ncbi:MAG: sulfurtransferase [Solirubrobacteraceae bacterium]
MPSSLVRVENLPENATVLDVRWQSATGAQPDLYASGHIPRAAFIDLDRDLSAPPGRRGRHPLPAPHDFEAAMRAAGVNNERPVVVYDDADGLPAARAWWLLRYFGHEQVALLDGGLAAWISDGRPLAEGDETPQQQGNFEARPGAMPVLDVNGAARMAAAGVLLDARAPERFRGESEPLDPVAGHIPGARNRPLDDDLVEGRFKSAAELEHEFGALGIEPGTAVGAYCGSGITAAHTVLALERAGIAAALYPGSWSEWVIDPSRPVATGEEP